MASITTCRKLKIIFFNLDVGFPFVATIVAGVGALLSFLVEKKAFCTPDCKLWVAGAACRYFLSFALCLFIQLVRYNLISYHSDLECFIKLAEVVDVCGILWFTIGNLLIFTSDQACATDQKICFSFAVILVASVYLVFFFPVIFHAILKCYREPVDSSQNDQMNGRDRAVELSANDAILSEATVHRWISWLKARGSIPFDYSAQLEDNTKHDKEQVIHFPESNEMSENDEWRSGKVEQVKVVEMDDDRYDHTILIPKIESSKHLLQCPICLDTLLPVATQEGKIYASATQDEESALPITEASPGAESVSLSNHVGMQSELNKCVAFPCRSHHLFHCRCLIEWLQTSTVRHTQRGIATGTTPVYTCPCCREQEPGELSCLP